MQVHECLSRTSSVRRQFEQVHWADTPLGPQDDWPACLRSVVQAVLCCGVPMVVAWGPELTMVYNDAYALLLGRRHPQALGQAYAQVWPEVWDAVWPDVQKALAGQSVSYRDAAFVLERSGAPEQTWWDYALSPLRDDAGTVRGMLAVFNETTARVQAQQQRQEQLLEMARLMEQAPNFMAVVHGPGHVHRSANRAYTDLLACGDVVGRSLRDALPQPCAPVLLEALDRCHAAGQTYVAHRMAGLFRRGTQEIVVDVVLQPLRDAAGQVEGVLIVGTDVTDLDRAERALRDSESRLRTLINGIPQLVWSVGEGGLAGFRNDRWYEYLGTTPNAMDATAWMDRMHPADRERVRSAWEEAQRTGTPYEGEYRLRRADGQWRWVLARGLPIPADAGQAPMQRWLGTITDIHATKSMEIALRDAKHRLEATLEAAEVGTWVWDVAANTVRADNNMAKLHNLPPDLAAATSMQSFCASVLPEDVQGIQQRFERTLATGEPFDATYRVPLPGGGVRHVHNRGKLIREAGRLWLPGVCVDVSRHKASEERLEAMNRRKDRFLALLAHELRNPLAPICSAAELLLRHPPASPEQVARLGGVLKRQSAQLELLVNDLMDVARINSGKVVLALVPCDLQDVVLQALEQVGMQARAKQLQLGFVPRQPVPVLGDASRLLQVVSNLLVNAIRYTPPHGAIDLDLALQGAEAVLQIRDTGRGLEPEELERVFELFEQADENAGEREAGLGLGLSLVRSLVRLHGGSVTLSSPGRGHGCTAQVRLPAAPAA